MLSKTLIFLALFAVLISAQSRYDRKRYEEERRRAAARYEDERRRAEEENRRYEEEQRRAAQLYEGLYEEEERRIEEETRRYEEERRRAEEAGRRAVAEEQRRAEEVRRQQDVARRQQDALRRQQEAIRRQQEAGRAVQEQRRAEKIRRPQQQRQTAEIRRPAEQRQTAEIRRPQEAPRRSEPLTRTREDYDITNTPEIRSPNWMSYVEHHRSIATLSIPGTHASMSFSGGSENQRQSWPLYKQYEAGIRYVDIRCRFYRNNLYVYHGKGSARHTLDAIMRETIKYLDKYPSEVILMRIRREGIPAYNRDTMGDTFRRLIVKYPSHRIWSSSRIPTLQDTRGRIVILQDFYSNFQVGINYKYLNIEDGGNVRNANAFTWKWDRVRQHLQTAQRGNPTNMYITHTGGAGSGLNPHAVANRINKNLWDFLQKSPGRNRFGIIAMDFPGARLVKKIVDTNF